MDVRQCELRGKGWGGRKGAAQLPGASTCIPPPQLRHSTCTPMAGSIFSLNLLLSYFSPSAASAASLGS